MNQQLLKLAIALLLSFPACLPAQDAKTPTADFYADIKRYVHHDFCVAVVIHPERITRSPLGKSIPMARFMAAAVQAAGLDAKQVARFVDPAKIRRLTIFAHPLPGGNVEFFPGVVLEYGQDTPGAEVLRAFWPTSRPSRDDERLFVDLEAMAGTALHGYVAGPRTILIAPEPTMKKMLSKFRAPSNPLLKQIGSAFVDSEIIVQFASRPVLKKYLALTGQTEAQLRADEETDEADKTMLLDVRSISLHLRLRRAQSVRATIHCDSRSNAVQVKKMLDTGKDMLLAVSNSKEAINELPPEIRDVVASQALKDTVRGMQVQQQATTIDVQLNLPRTALNLAKRSATEFAKKAPAPAKTDFAAFAGKWRINYANKAVREYKIDKTGLVTYRRRRYRLTSSKDGVQLVHVKGAELELLSARDGKLHVKHYNLTPKYAKQTKYPGKPTTTGVGVRVK